MNGGLVDPSKWKSWIDEHFEFSQSQLWASIGLLIVFLLGVGLLYLQDNGGGPVVREQRVGVRGGGAAAGRSGSRPGGGGAVHAAHAQRSGRRPARPRLVVHVAGAVGRPGVYRLAAGSRVVNAVEAAGGGGPGADLDSLNLAALLVDGQKIMVPVVGQVVAPDAIADVPGSDAKLSLNTASAEQLDQLDGIGPVLAKRIIEYRQRRGRFTSVDQLQNVQGIGVKKLALIRSVVRLN